MVGLWVKLMWATSLVAAANESALYDFAYGVRDFETGDIKSHQQSVSPSGVVEGEYRWLKPNGRISITRYFVNEKSGFRVTITEEPGPDLLNIQPEYTSEPPTALESPAVSDGEEERSVSVQAEDSSDLALKSEDLGLDSLSTSEDLGLDSLSTSIQLVDQQPLDVHDDDDSLDVAAAEDLETGVIRK